MYNNESPVIYVVSDSLGETAEFVARAAASQFNAGRVELRRVPYVSGKEQIAEIIEEARCFKSVIAYTIVIPELKEELLRLAKAHQLPLVDILGPMVDALSGMTGTEPKLEPGLLRKLDEQYFRKVEAIEFAVKYDDGKDPRGLAYADVVLVGVSRTSKTPVSMYLAHKRVKAANIPLVPEVAPPEELFETSPKKIFGLTISPQLLNEIRQERLKTLGLTSNADYANLERILAELEYSEKIMKRIGCPIIDVTNRAVEETASTILELYYKGERYV